MKPFNFSDHLIGSHAYPSEPCHTRGPWATLKRIREATNFSGSFPYTYSHRLINSDKIRHTNLCAEGVFLRVSHASITRGGAPALPFCDSNFRPCLTYGKHISTVKKLREMLLWRVTMVHWAVWPRPMLTHDLFPVANLLVYLHIIFLLQLPPPSSFSSICRINVLSLITSTSVLHSLTHSLAVFLPTHDCTHRHNTLHWNTPLTVSSSHCLSIPYLETCQSVSHKTSIQLFSSLLRIMVTQFFRLTIQASLPASIQSLTIRPYTHA